jgi:hypothetical protein
MAQFDSPLSPQHSLFCEAARVAELDASWSKPFASFENSTTSFLELNPIRLNVPKPGVIFVTVDPGNPALHSNVDRSLERMFAHEPHHAARWDGPGYGSSLCEALVSEDLQVISCWSFFGGSPEPWEQLPEGEIRFHATHAGQGQGQLQPRRLVLRQRQSA